jgi:hypothetical protein
MSAVLTTASVVQCSHKAAVTLKASQSKLKAAGNPVLVLSDLVGATVVLCPNLPTPATPALKPCTSALSVAAGQATKLTVDNQPVLLESATGPTDSNPPGTWSVTSAGQTVLTAT